ncbi:hypothetical protein LEN26_015703 [Aphanomyces euteiches]|nr:hypothetical protein LEN26_015703 [Aphanomyces euteiches]KAH9110300.1 hypothetical protein AeMF1_014843 [Aphanomyces euteiches]
MSVEAETSSPVLEGAALTKSSLSAVRCVENSTRDLQAKQWAEERGLDIVNVSWEDCARFQGSCWGPCISDMTLVVKKRWMPVLRVPNFSDPIMSIPSSQIQVFVGNESPYDAPLTKISLENYLQNISKYTELTNSLFHTRQRQSSCGEHAVVLFADSSDGRSRFSLATDAGTSAQVVNGDYRGDILYFNDHGTKRTFRAESLSTDRAKRGVDTTEVMTQEEEARNYIMIVQIPLIKPFDPLARKRSVRSRTTKKRKQGEGMENDADVEPAMVGLGSSHGPFPKLSKHADIRRDPNYPIRVTLQYYQATSNGVVTQSIIDNLARQMEEVKTKATWCGSLVVPESNTA